MQEEQPAFFEIWFEKKTVKRAVNVGAVVGTILCLINQWQGIVLGAVPIDWLKIVLTYCVPYCVSSYSTVASRLEDMNP